jgi:hypothetical protein
MVTWEQLPPACAQENPRLSVQFLATNRFGLIN